MHKRCCPHPHGGNSLVSGDGNQSIKYVNILSSYSVFCPYFVARYSGGIQEKCITVKPLKRHSDHLELLSFLLFPFLLLICFLFSSDNIPFLILSGHNLPLVYHMGRLQIEVS